MAEMETLSSQTERLLFDTIIELQEIYEPRILSSLPYSRGVLQRFLIGRGIKFRVWDYERRGLPYNDRDLVSEITPPYEKIFCSSNITYVLLARSESWIFESVHHFKSQMIPLLQVFES